MGTLLFFSVLLVGPFSEGHYLLIGVPCLLAALAFEGRWVGLAVALPGLFLFAFPRYYIGSPASSPQDLQVRYVLAETLLTAAVAVIVTPSFRARIS